MSQIAGCTPTTLEISHPNKFANSYWNRERDSQPFHPTCRGIMERASDSGVQWPETSGQNWQPQNCRS
eukprot:1132884-Pleurochrysis_carterae.AAC.1